MKKLILSHEGIFPVTKDADGSMLSCPPATGLNCAGTIQGEGKLAGIPSLFVRLAMCNMRCTWKLPNDKLCCCDTNYAASQTHLCVDEAVEIISNNLGRVRHVVVTGGEPLLQKDALADFVRRLKSETGVHITLETNGTIFDSNAVRNIDLFSLSPKLKNSASDALNNDWIRRVNINVIQSFIDTARNTGKDIQLKFVVAQAEEEAEIKEQFLDKLCNLDVSDVLVMPLGATNDDLQMTSRTAFAIAVKNGWRYSPRLHINLFGNETGV
ncbi:MAG: 7-carboxy-7-deazaguanine synthase QueE [Cytophagaceae bacterium]|nr:7-carboxy-7-deazaguanine synthase QueE [Cytophagaceae bacterium]